MSHMEPIISRFFRPVTPVEKRRLLSLEDASDLLWRWNNTILVNQVRGEEKPPPMGAYAVRAQVFNELAKIASSNPMADQRAETGWRLCVSRGGVEPWFGLRCSTPSYHTAWQDYALVFEVPELRNQARPLQ